MKAAGVGHRNDQVQFVFCHLFHLMGWNTMSRCSNTSTISFNHLGWQDDSLLVYICQAKNDKEGLLCDKPKHIFANPVLPEICPVLSMAIFLSIIDVPENSYVVSTWRSSAKIT
jgi:hypothetical protein